MAAFDNQALSTDPGVIASGGAPIEGQEVEGAACVAAKASYRTALMFRVLFTSLVFIFSAALLILLVITLWTILKNSDNAKIIASAAGTVVSGGAVAYLGRQMNRSIKVADDALAHVSTYCGTQVAADLKK